MCIRDSGYTVTQDATIEVVATDAAGSTSVTKSFTVSLAIPVESAAIPSYMRQGINYDPADPTKVGLALYAPGKPYVHVIGSFNNWTVSGNYLMKKDTGNANLFWIEITGLTPQQIYTFQYRIADGTRVADPYSTLVLSPLTILISTRMRWFILISQLILWDKILRCLLFRPKNQLILGW